MKKTPPNLPEGEALRQILSMGISDNERTGFKSINVNIELRTNADKATEALLIEKVKSRCPVNDNLANPTPIHYSFN